MPGMCRNEAEMQTEAMRVRMIVPNAPWTRALIDGSVPVPGVELDCATTGETAPERFGAAASAQVEVGEAGIRTILLEHERGEPARALPVWFGREHMQRNVIVRQDSPLRHPRDLIGKRIGSRQPIVSGTNAGIVMMLDQGYGIAPTDVEWVVRSADGLPANRLGVRFTFGPDSYDGIFAMLQRGEVDAVTVTAGPRYWSLFGPDGVDREIAKYGGLRPLITGPELIAETYRRTGLYPITDLVALRPGLAEQHPELPAKLVAAYAEANALARKYRDAAEQRLAEREIELLGEDPHEYGLTPKARASLAALIDLFYRLGAIESASDPEALFVA
jgi:4,5-dihydroxyphthalate decarboxylase